DDDEADHGDNEMADIDASWTIGHWTRVGDRGAWTPAGDPIVWPHPFAPLFSCKNLPRPNSFWGKPDITPDIVGLNNALNLNESDINRLGRLTAARLSPLLALVTRELTTNQGKSRCYQHWKASWRHCTLPVTSPACGRSARTCAVASMR